MSLSEKSTAKFKKNSLFTTMTTLSFIGNIIWFILFGILLSGSLMNSASIVESFSVDGIKGGIMFIFAIISAIVVSSCIVSLIGLVKMRKGKKRGFGYYAIGNGVWVLMMIYMTFGDYGYAIVSAIISILFILFFFFKSRQMA